MQRHGTGKFPSLLSEVQKRKFSDNQKRNYNHYQRARRLDAEPIIYKLLQLIDYRLILVSVLFW